MTHDLIRRLSETPRLDERSASDVLRERWAIEGTLVDIGSMQDQNLRIDTVGGPTYLLKVSAAAVPIQELDLQNAAMNRVRTQLLERCPRPVPTLDGAEVVTTPEHHLRVVTWVTGTPLADRPWLDASDHRFLGALAARVAGALAGLEHPGANRRLEWDPRHASTVVDQLAPDIDDPDLRGLVLAASAHVGRVPDLPLVMVHGDVTPTNVLAPPWPEPATSENGIIDFGDVMLTWRVCDAAATTLGLLEHPASAGVLGTVGAVLAGYHGVAELSEADAEAFWPVLLARAAANAALTRTRARLNPGNGYVVESARSGRAALELLAGVPWALASAAVRSALGLVPAPATAERVATTPKSVVEVVPGVHDHRIPVLDLSVDGDLFEQGEIDRAGMAALTQGGLALARWGEARPAEGDLVHGAGPARLHLGVDVFAPVGTQVRTPVAGTVDSVEAHEAVIRPASAPSGPLLRLAGLRPSGSLGLGKEVREGDDVGVVAESDDGWPAHVHIQWLANRGLPSYGDMADRAAWLAICPDPSSLIGVTAAAPHWPTAEEQRHRRGLVVASPQHLYYVEPLEIVRGWRHFLYDANGRRYLDMINNIATIGHSHPRVTAAADRQLRRLNTNSRFLYHSMTRYSARFVELLPPGLDRVFLVNSGSEAADLALQLARVYTGDRDVIAIRGAYHGWTGAVIDVSTSPYDHPHWREELPSYVHIVEQPDPYRGRHGADAAAYAMSVRQACDAATASDGLAAFVSEPMLGNQGAVEPPAGYLRLAYEAVRAAGGLCIADEVQVGMARTGDFWAFQHEEVVPDIVYTAKAAGNGHPIGVVACRAEVADAYDRHTAFFSSTGGGPVSCEIGTAVLDVIRDEDLLGNARRLGGWLKTALVALSERHAMVGAVHGRGLYLGVDLVRDRKTREPATQEAAMISERLRHHGIMMHVAGDGLNVLKVKPPLCLDQAAATYFVDTLDRVLEDVTVA